MARNAVVKLHKGQKTVMSSPTRFRVIVAGRRWGKTQISKISLIRAAAEKQNQLCWYVAPTYQMARDILWEDLKTSVPRAWVAPNGINETRMTIKLKNGSRIMLKGADKPDSLRGVGLNFLVVDEAQDIHPDTWNLVLQPTLSTTGGRAIIIGTPKAFNWLYEKYQLGQRPRIIVDRDTGAKEKNEWESWQYPTISSPFIPKSEIEQRRRDMDPRSFRQEYEASFESMSGRVYYPFDRKLHVGDYPFDPRLPLYIGMDFNIDPMSMIMLQERSNGEIWAVDEAVLFGSNVEEAADEMARRYFPYMKQITIFPDPAGTQKGHARGESSLDILREAGFRNIQFKRKHPAVDDRVNAVNRLLYTADGTVRLKIDQRCRNLIDSLEQTIYKEGSREINKQLGTEHPTDALGYFADFRHPFRNDQISGLSF